MVITIEPPHRILKFNQYSNLDAIKAIILSSGGIITPQATKALTEYVHPALPFQKVKKTSLKGIFMALSVGELCESEQAELPEILTAAKKDHQLDPCVNPGLAMLLWVLGCDMPKGTTLYPAMEPLPAETMAFGKMGIKSHYGIFEASYKIEGIKISWNTHPTPDKERMSYVLKNSREKDNPIFYSENDIFLFQRRFSKK